MWSSKNVEIILKLSGSCVLDSVQVIFVSKDCFFLSLGVEILAELQIEETAK